MSFTVKCDNVLMIQFKLVLQGITVIEFHIEVENIFSIYTLHSFL